MIVLPARLRQRPTGSRRLTNGFAQNNLYRVNPAASIINQVDGAMGTNNDAANTKVRAGRFGQAISVISAGGAACYYWSAARANHVAPFTILLHFVNVDAITSGGFFSLAGVTSSTTPTLLLNADAGNNLRLYYNNGYQITASGVLTAGSTHYLGITHDGTTLTMVRNGVTVGTYTNAFAVNNPTFFFVGNGYPSSALSETNLFAFIQSATPINRLKELTRLPLGAAFAPMRRRISGWASSGASPAGGTRPVVFFST